ncbi:MAG: CvpA family protein [Eubacteriales bacterium]|nr:CvpA family protein [Eubacteriales bacterium]NLN92181.1 CvpA family protein [Candidatus Hydrogenedens sp.]NLV69992.1 CvpA family protein [Clostridiales bacterium]HPF18585.1 CvpA family protein [Bacillota bacterium]MDD3537468.1 CvpA family protein [Eubacteriales bacterium]
MILDICLGIILLLSVIVGYRKGFTEAFLHTIGWILAIVLGFVWTPAVAAFLRSNTPMEESLRTIFNERLAQAGAEGQEGLLSGIPEILSDYFSDAVSVIQSNTVENLVGIIMTILALLCIILVIKLIFFLITLLFSKKKRGGIIAFSDGMLGLAFGAVKGMLFICILLAFFLPLANFFQSDVLIDQLYESTYAIRIYDNNPIFLLTQIFF